MGVGGEEKRWGNKQGKEVLPKSGLEELYKYITEECALGKAMAAHCSTAAWKIPWTEEPGRLWSMGLRRVGHDWSDAAAVAVHQVMSGRFTEDLHLLQPNQVSKDTEAGKLQRRARSLHGLLWKVIKCLLSGWSASHHQISKILEWLWLISNGEPMSTFKLSIIA